MNDTSIEMRPEQQSRNLLPRKALVLPSSLTLQQKHEIYEAIEVLMDHTGFRQRFRRSVEINVSAFEGNLRAMLVAVSSDYQPILIKMINDLIQVTEDAHLGFLVEFGELVVAKQEAEERLRALETQQRAVSDVTEEYSRRLRRVLASTEETITTMIRRHHDDLSKTADFVAEHELRQAIAQAYGLAKTLGWLNYKTVKSEILEALERYV